MNQYSHDAFQRWEAEFPELEGQVRLVEILQQAQTTIQERLGNVAVGLAKEAQIQNLGEGEALAIADTLAISDNQWEEFFSLVVGLVVDHFPTEEGTMLLVAVQHGKLDVPALMQHTLHQDLEPLEQLADQLELDLELLVFMASHVLLPVLDRYRSNIDWSLVQEHWKEGYCPICARPPLFDLKGEGLFCSQCQAIWSFPAGRCHECGEAIHIQDAELPGFRIRLCDTNQHYLRQIEPVLLERYDPSLLDILSADLASQFEEQGYE